MIEPLLVTSSLLLGKEMFTQTITTTTNNIYSGIDKLLMNDNIEFKKICEELDINIKLDIINTFIIDIHNSDKIFNESINKTFKYLEEILKTIELEIENINNELLFYEQIWFRKFRKCNYTIMINNLVKHVKLLDSRFELLIKLIKI
jgi:hypothetical protein